MTIVAVVRFVVIVWLYAPSISAGPRLLYRQPAHDAKECGELAAAILEAGPPPAYLGDDPVPHRYGAACVRETTFVRQEPA